MKEVPVSKTMMVLADDDLQVRIMIRTMLSHSGFVVRDTEDGESALHIIHRSAGRISLLVSDVDMSGLSGVDLATIVRERFPQIPILLISGRADSLECCAADAFLSKPFTFEGLMNAVSHVMHLQPSAT